MREFDLTKLGYRFQTKPLLIGGMAMEYYGLRQAGADIDFVITEVDYIALADLYPEYKRDLFGDMGVCVYEYEMWKCICLYDYDDLSQDAIEKEMYRIVSLEKLLFLKALGHKVPKYQHDLELVVEKILNIQYGKDTLPD